MTLLCSTRVTAGFDRSGAGRPLAALPGRSLVGNGARDRGKLGLAVVATMGLVFRVCAGAAKCSLVDEGTSAGEATFERRVPFDGRIPFGRAAALLVEAGEAAPDSSVAHGSARRRDRAGAASHWSTPFQCLSWTIDCRVARHVALAHMN